MSRAAEIRFLATEVMGWTENEGAWWKYTFRVCRTDQFDPFTIHSDCAALLEVVPPERHEEVTQHLLSLLWDLEPEHA